MDSLGATTGLTLLRLARNCTKLEGQQNVLCLLAVGSKIWRKRRGNPTGCDIQTCTERTRTVTELCLFKSRVAGSFRPAYTLFRANIELTSEASTLV